MQGVTKIKSCSIGGQLRTATKRETQAIIEEDPLYDTEVVKMSHPFRSALGSNVT